MGKSFRFTLLYVSWMVFITLLSLFSFSGVETEGWEFPHEDKLAHFVFYFVAVVLGALCLAERGRERRNSKRLIVSVILFSIIFGIVIEGLQWIMPFGREADLWDIFANSLGAIVGGLLIQRYGSLNTRGN